MTTDITPAAIPPRIELALRQASRATGTDFDYLLDTAIRESGLKSDAKSKSSSATGLFQFIENTWLGMVKTAGSALGFGDLADKIEETPGGRFKVADQGARREILALRNDPEAAALMAGAYARDSEQALESRLGRAPSNGELYIAHFLGRSGASKLLDAVNATPDATAADLFPKAAAANRSIFYDRLGGALTVAEVRDRLISEHRAGPVQLAGARADGDKAMPVISPAAARYLRPANLAAGEGDGSRIWGRSLYTPVRGEAERPRSGGPMVLDSARLVALIEENLDSRTSAPASPAGLTISHETEGAPRRRPLGLLERRSPFVELFRST